MASPDTNLEELAIKAQNGDRVAYAQLLQNLTPYIRGAVRKKLGSLVDVDDVTQECLLGVHKNLASYHPSQPLQPWVSAIIRYKLADHFRRLSKKPEVSLDQVGENVTTEASEANNPLETASQSAMAETLDKLPVKLKSALVRTHIDGLSYTEAAESEGISEAALRKRISRAFAHLRKEVQKHMEIEI